MVGPLMMIFPPLTVAEAESSLVDEVAEPPMVRVPLPLLFNFSVVVAGSLLILTEPAPGKFAVVVPLVA